jgi:hypothetical protein
MRWEEKSAGGDFKDARIWVRPSFAVRSRAKHANTFLSDKTAYSFSADEAGGNVLLNHYVEPVGQDAGTARSWGKV